MDGGGKANSVPAAELTRNFGRWQDRVSHGPVFVTNHGRPRAVLMSMEDYARIVAIPPDAAGVETDPASALLIERLDDGFIAFDDQEIIRRVNTAAALHFGRAPDEILGRPLDRLKGLPGSPVVVGYARRALAAGEVATIDAPSIRHPGEIIRVQVFPFAGGGACLFRNVTPQRRAAEAAAGQAALAEALDRLGGIVHARLTVEGRFDEIGEIHARRLGLAVDRLRQIRLFDVLAVACRAKARTVFEDVVGNGRARAFDGQLLIEGAGERAARIALAPIREDFAIGGVTLAMSA